MSARGIPQIAAVLGSCTAGGAYVPAMSDETVIVRNQGTIFLGGPPLVKAATGEVVTAEELGGGDLHARTSGVVDHLAEDDAHALRIVRSIVATLAPRPPAPWHVAASEEPARGPGRAVRRGAGRLAYPVRRARGHRPHRGRQPVRRVQAGVRRRPWSPGSRISTGTRSASWPTTASCSASPRSRARTSSSCATSARSRWCSCRTSPVSWSAASTRPGGIAKHGAKMVTAVACARVPKFTVIIGGSFGAGQLRHVRPGLLAPLPVDVAERADLGHGRRPGRQRAGHRAPRPAGGGWPRTGPPRPRRSSSGRSATSTSTRATRTTRPRGCGTTGSSTRLDTRRVLGLALSAAANAPLEPVPTASSGCGRDGDVRHRPDGQPRRDRGPRHPHPAGARHRAASRSTATPTPAPGTSARPMCAVRLGPAPAADSYLNIEAILAAARPGRRAGRAPGLRVPVRERRVRPRLRRRRA